MKSEAALSLWSVGSFTDTLVQDHLLSLENKTRNTQVSSSSRCVFSHKLSSPRSVRSTSDFV